MKITKNGLKWDVEIPEESVDSPDSLKATMKRQYVYQLIDGERNYQNTRWNDKTNDEDKSIAEFIIYMEHTLNKAKNAIYELDEESALDHIRKTTALGVAIMEHNYTKARD